MSLSGDDDKDRERLRERIAEAGGLDLYGRYSEYQASLVLGMHRQTLKQLRLAGRIQATKISRRNICYFGFQIVDYLIESMSWPSPFTKLENTGSGGATAQTSSTATGGMGSVDAHDALASARRTLKKPSKD